LLTVQGLPDVQLESPPVPPAAAPPVPLAPAT
jgi:hypothetical protein